MDKDIVARLREWINGRLPRDRVLDHDLLDAVHAIERLRKDLMDARKSHPGYNGEIGQSHMMT